MTLKTSNRNAEETGVEMCHVIVSGVVTWDAITGEGGRGGGGGRMRLADWQINQVNIVVKCPNRFLIPKLDF